MTSARSRRWRLGVAGALIGLLAVGCAQIGAAVTIDNALRDAGYDASGVNVNTTNGHTTVDVSWSSKAKDVAALGEEFLEVRSIVWTKAPIDVDTLRLTANGTSDFSNLSSQSHFYPESALRQELGPRPDDIAVDGFDSALVTRWLVIVAVVLAAVIALVVWLVRRGRAARNQVWRAGGRQASPPPGWGPPPPGWGHQVPGYGPSPPGYRPPPGYGPPPPGYGPPPPGYGPPPPPTPG